MARAVKWSPVSLAELEKISEYLESEAPAYARAVIVEIFAKARSLSHLSERGRIVPEFAEATVREVFIHNFRLIYRVTESDVEVLTVFHGSRLLRPDDVKE